MMNSLMRDQKADVCEYVVGADTTKHPFQELNPEWSTLVSSGSDEEGEDASSRSWVHTQDDGDRPSVEHANHEAWEELPENLKVKQDLPEMFIPLRFRLPELPLKVVKPQQFELDEGLGVFLPRTLIDDEFKEQLEEELLALMPRYTSLEHFLEIDEDVRPPLNQREKWIIAKRRERLIATYKRELQKLRKRLLEEHHAVNSEIRKPLSNTMIELCAFRRSRPDYQAYMKFIEIFKYRYNHLPGLMKSVSGNETRATAANVEAFAKELNSAKLKARTKGCQLQLPAKILERYRIKRRQKQIEEEKQRRDAERLEKVTRLSRNTTHSSEKQKDERLKRPLTFKDRLKAARRTLVLRKQMAQAGNREPKVGFKHMSHQTEDRKCHKNSERFGKCHSLVHIPVGCHNMTAPVSSLERLHLIGVNFSSLDSMTDDSCNPVGNNRLNATGSGRNSDERKTGEGTSKKVPSFLIGANGKGSESVIGDDIIEEEIQKANTIPQYTMPKPRPKRRHFRFIKRERTSATDKMLKALQRNELLRDNLLSEKQKQRVMAAATPRPAEKNLQHANGRAESRRQRGTLGHRALPKIKRKYLHDFTEQLRNQMDKTSNVIHNVSSEGDFLPYETLPEVQDAIGDSRAGDAHSRLLTAEDSGEDSGEDLGKNDLKTKLQKVLDIALSDELGLMSGNTHTEKMHYLEELLSSDCCGKCGKPRRPSTGVADDSISKMQLAITSKEEPETGKDDRMDQEAEKEIPSAEEVTDHADEDELVTERDANPDVGIGSTKENSEGFSRHPRNPSTYNNWRLQRKRKNPVSVTATTTHQGSKLRERRVSQATRTLPSTQTGTRTLVPRVYSLLHVINDYHFPKIKSAKDSSRKLEQKAGIQTRRITQKIPKRYDVFSLEDIPVASRSRRCLNIWKGISHVAKYTSASHFDITDGQHDRERPKSLPLCLKKWHNYLDKFI